MANPLVSILMPTFNSSKTVLRAIQSVQNQTYVNWELLISDDKSTDNTVDLINSMLDDDRIKFYALETNMGAGVARNVGLDRARGRYIAFCDSDDYWLPKKLERQINFMLENEIYLCYTHYFQENSRNERTHIVVSPDRVNYQKMLRTNYIGCLTAVYDAGYLGKVVIPNRRKRQDWLLWLRILERIDYAYCFREPLSVYCMSTDSLSGNKRRLINETISIYKNELRIGTFKSLWMFLIFSFSYVSKENSKQRL